MPTSFRPYLPNQALLLPSDPREWVPEGHLAHQVSDLVDSLDLSAFYAPYEGDGRRNARCDPSMMVKVLIYAYATGTFSSRRIAGKLEEDVALRMLAAGNFPQHRTVCEFRRRHLEDFRALFVEVVRTARAMGLASFGALSVDGTKVRANASKRKAMSYERMQREEARLEGEVEGILAAARSADDEEDALHGEGVRGGEVPEALRGGERRLAAIREARARLDAEAREAPPRPKTKPDAAPADREAEPPRQEMKADAAAPPPANREASGEPPRQGMKADAAAGQAETAASEPAVDPLLELRIRERRLETIRASRGRLEAAAGNGDRPAAPWASPSRRPKATRRIRRAGS